VHITEISRIIVDLRVDDDVPESDGITNSKDKPAERAAAMIAVLRSRGTADGV
jgi:hypothetical protein